MTYFSNYKSYLEFNFRLKKKECHFFSETIALCKTRKHLEKKNAFKCFFFLILENICAYTYY